MFTSLEVKHDFKSLNLGKSLLTVTYASFLVSNKLVFEKVDLVDKQNVINLNS